MKNFAEELKKEISEQDNYYSVIVDGNTHPQLFNIQARTKKEQITLKKCKEICTKIENQFNIEVTEIQILLTQYDYRNITPDQYEASWYCDFNIPIIGYKKTATYNHQKNRLRIYEDGYPVYENNNGVICKDRTELTDCIC